MNQTARFVIVMGVITAALAALGMGFAGAGGPSPYGAASPHPPTAQPGASDNPHPHATLGAHPASHPQH